MPHIEEQSGIELFKRLGFQCFGNTGQIKKRDLFPNTDTLGSGEHLEFDYLLPYNELCIVGEITGRINKQDVKNKYEKFRNHVNLFSSSHLKLKEAVELFDIPDESRRLFDSVKSIKPFFVIPEHERYDIDLGIQSGIPVLYRSDWNMLQKYAEYMASYTKNLFLNLINISSLDDQEKDLRIEAAKNRLVHEPNRIIADVATRADIFTFIISPEDLLPITEVLRRELMPLMPPKQRERTDNMYQRPLDFAKLREMVKLARKERFMFPNSILVALDEDCSYEEDVLRIPLKYGAISLIDGQHRLFSYASQDVPNESRHRARLLVTALKFRTSDKAEILRCSAKTFIEINQNQKRISSEHIDEIAYSVLSEETPRALAAQIILRANQRHRKVLESMFITRQTSGGFYKAATVITALAPIVSLKTISSLKRAKLDGKLTQRKGYENLFRKEEETEILDLSKLFDNSENIIQRGVMVLERYSAFVKKTFNSDWPKNDTDKGSSLQYTKIFSAFVKLLNQFICENLDWNDIEEELKKIRTNILVMQELTDGYRGIVLSKNIEEIPDKGETVKISFQFFNENRFRPTKLSEVKKKNQ
jgi:DGQHR domain-containing protein